MQSATARLTATTAGVAREARRWGLAAALVVVGSNGLQDAVATGETRSLALRHTHRDDVITVTFKRNGVYDDDALKKLNWFLRDWRTDDQIRMDPHLFDILWEVSREVDATEPINIVSSYRSPKTNEMLRRRGRGVARQSQHMLGRAIDFYIPGAPLEGLRNAGLRLQRGGVGFYPTSGSPFIHLDTGSVRHWPRLSRDQLARVFPDGRTVHLPSDGEPLAGYSLAASDIEKRNAGGDPSVRSGERPGRSLFARIFGIGKSGQDDEDEAEVTGSAKRGPTIAAPRQVAALDKRPVAEPKKPAQAPVAVSMERLVTVPLPSARPAQPVAVASISPTLAKPQVASNEPAQPTVTAFEGRFALAAMTPNEIVATRGFWRGLPEAPPRAQIASPSREPNARVALAGVAPSSASVPAHSDFAASFAMFKDGESQALAYAPEGRTGASSITEMSSSDHRSTSIAASAPVVTGGIAQAIRDRVAPLFAPRRAYAAAGPIGVAAGADEVWTRAIILAPDLHNHLTTSLLGAPDFVALQPLMRKPAAALMMTFSIGPEATQATPHRGQFDGVALIFPQTVSFRVADAR